jgi:peptide/nickel transport system substrate-binding protein
MSSGGHYEPDLATSWKFADKQNEVFELHLRSGVKFSDGSVLTAAAVADSMNRFIKTPGVNQANPGPVAHVDAVGTDIVQVHYSEPVPFSFAQESMTQDYNFGLIVGEKGTKNPSSLNTGTDGAGQYVIDPAQTTKGSVYTYVPNKLYFNKAAIKFSKIVVKPITDPAARLSALQSGQIDWAHDLPSGDVAAVRNSGATVAYGPGNRVMLLLENRTSGPLADVRVRQALAYAVDRASIMKSVYSGVGTTGSSWSAKGMAGYNAANPNPYPYNVAKAKQLLAAAGYPRGFTLTAVDAQAIDPNGTLGQALASAYQAIGVTLKLRLVTGSINVFAQALLSKQYQTAVFPLKNLDTYSSIRQFLAPGALGNAFGLTDPTLNGLLKTASSASSATSQGALMAQVTARLDDQVWGVVVGVNSSTQGISAKLKNVPAQYSTYDLDPVSPVASQSWFK